MKQDKEEKDDELRLERCDLSKCEGTCCYDGAYLEDGEEEALVALVTRESVFFSFLEGPSVVDGNWRGLIMGRKTGVRPHTYRNPDFPPHFAATRCILALPDARCSLQVLAETQKLHPWSYKPRACWLHPLNEGPSGLTPPPVDPAKDPHRIDDAYPGFVCYTPCGRHRPDGRPWKEVLAEEILYFREHPPQKR